MEWPLVLQDIVWNPTAATLRNSAFVDFWGQTTIPISAVTDDKTRKRLDTFARHVQQTGQGFAGPFPLLLEEGWLMARWIAERRDEDHFRLAWLDIEYLPLTSTSATQDLRRARMVQLIRELPALTRSQREFLAVSLQTDEKSEFALHSVLRENPLLEIRLLSSLAHPRIKGQDDTPSLAKALVFWGLIRVIEVLRIILMAQAIPEGTRLARTVQFSKFLLESFTAASQRMPRPAYLRFWLNALLFSESLLTHYSLREREPLLRRLETHISDLFAIQRFLYGVHALEIAEMLTQSWEMDLPGLTRKERDWLGLAYDLVPWLNSIANNPGGSGTSWSLRGLLAMENPEHPLWGAAVALDQERLHAFLDFQL